MKFGDMRTDDMKLLKQLGPANNRLKNILAERNLEIEVMKHSVSFKFHLTCLFVYFGKFRVVYFRPRCPNPAFVQQKISH